MPETEKTSFFHSLTFNCSIIVMFFQLFVGGLTIATVAGLHALGAAAGDELSRYDETPVKPAVEAPKPRPAYPAEGIPVAYRSAGIRP